MGWYNNNNNNKMQIITLKFIYFNFKKLKDQRLDVLGETFLKGPKIITLFDH
jgi:hypothetical protein